MSDRSSSRNHSVTTSSFPELSHAESGDTTRQGGKARDEHGDERMGGASPRSGLAVSLAAASASVSSLMPKPMPMPRLVTAKQPEISEIQPMDTDEDDEEGWNKATTSFANWSSSRPVVIPEYSYRGASSFGGRTYHVSLLSTDKSPVDAAGSQKGKTSPLSSSIAKVASFVGSLVGGGADGRPSPSPSPSPSHVLKSYLRAPSDNLDEHIHVQRDDSSLLPHHHYSSHRPQRAAQQSMSSSGYGLLSRSLGVGQSNLLGGGDEGMSNILSRPLGRVHGSAAGRERGTIEQEMMDGWGRRKSYAAKGAPPRSKWTKTSADLPLTRPPKSQSTAALSSLAHSPNASLHQSPMSMISEDNAVASRSKRSSDAQSISQDIAVIVGSLPSSFGTPVRAMKRVESTNNIASSSAERQTSVPSPTVHRTTPLVQQAALRKVRSQPYMLLDGAECQDLTLSSPAPAPPVPSLQQAQATHFPICLICLEMLTPEDFQSGEAIQLECSCSGDIALRHLTCAIEWNNAKGNLLCEVCKQLITNLPPIDPELLEAREAAKRRREPNFSVNSDMTWADHAFDAIRMMWIVAICCVIFYDLSMSTSFLIGAASGVIYVVLASIFRWISGLCSHWLQLRRWEREREAQERQMSRERVERERRRHMVGGREGPSDLSEPLLISIQ